VQFVKEQLTFTGEDTAMATLLLSVMGAFAEFERSLIRERQREGIALARQRGAYRGRTRALDAEQVAQLRKRVADGIPKATLAREFGVSRETVDGKSNEITAFAPLLDGLDITGAIVTADALHTQRGHAEYLTGRGAHYLFTVKGNQPTLYAQLKALPWRDIPAVDVTRGKGHGRLESRTVKVTAVSVGIGFPHARLAIQITRRRRPLTGRKWKTETVYAITDLDQTQIRPDEIADIIRAHWHIENKLHWVRDVTLGEDASQIRTGHGPAVMATLRNLAISVHRRHGATNIAAATRRVARHPSRAIPLLL